LPVLLIESDRWLPRPPSGIWEADLLAAARERIALGLYAAVSAFADAGNDILVDGLLPSSDALKQACLRALQRHRLVVIGLTASTSTLAERERRRGDRCPGTAVTQAASAGANVRYDIALDADDADPVSLAEQARNQLRTRLGLR
jgi:chloramphenicol 3-O-phosphotransferase